MHEQNPYENAARETVELGNRIADADQQADLWDIADGLLAGAVQYWLYSREPCGDPTCQDCAPVCNAEWRLQELLQYIEQCARSSEYFHSPKDMKAGNA